MLLVSSGTPAQKPNGSRERLNVSHSAPSSSQGLDELYGESPFDGSEELERKARLALELGGKDEEPFSEDASSVSVDSHDPKAFLDGKKLEAIVDPAPPFYNAEVGSRSTLFAFNRNKHFCEPLVTYGRLEFIVEYLTTEAGKKYILAFLCYYHEVATADDIVNVLYDLADTSQPDPVRIVVPTKKDLRCVYRAPSGQNTTCLLGTSKAKEFATKIGKGNGGQNHTGNTTLQNTLVGIGVAGKQDPVPNMTKLKVEEPNTNGHKVNEMIDTGIQGEGRTEQRDSVASSVKVVNSVSFFSALYGRIGFPTERDHRGVAEFLKIFVRDFNLLSELTDKGIQKLDAVCVKLGPHSSEIISIMKNVSGNRDGKTRLSQKRQSSSFPEAHKSSGQDNCTRRRRMRAQLWGNVTKLYDQLSFNITTFVVNEKREMYRRYSAFKQQVFGHRAKSLGEFYKYTEKQVAVELTRDLFEIYSRIGPKEMLTLEARQKSENVHKMIDMFNSYSWWCVHWVLTGLMDRKDEPPEDVSDRVNRLLYMMKVAEECRQLNSFHAFFGLMGGLCQPQLMWVWEFAKEKDKVHFNNLKRAVSPNSDYRVYRADLSKCADDTYIPFLGYTTKVLYTFEKQIGAFSPDFKDLIDFGRLISMFATVEEFLDGNKSVVKSSSPGMFWGSKTEAPKTTSRKATRRLAKILRKQLEECKSSEQLDEISQEQQDNMRTVLLDSLKTSGFL